MQSLFGILKVGILMVFLKIKFWVTCIFLVCAGFSNADDLSVEQIKQSKLKIKQLQQKKE